MNPLLQFTGITQRFGSVAVLRDVTFPVGPGRTVGLVGENGAGKSTLMNILGGNLRPDAGHMRLDGRDYAPARPADARAAGIGFVHQELNLFPNLTVAENLFLPCLPRTPGLPFVSRRCLHERTAARLRDVGLELAPETPLERLSAAERQLVEIAKALSFDARLIILDEPTTSLSRPEAEHLFQLLGQLHAGGLALIYISHALADVLRLCDDLVVLRDGQVVEQGPRADFDTGRLISLMVGRTLEQLYPPRRGTSERGHSCPPAPNSAPDDEPRSRGRKPAQPAPGFAGEVSADCPSAATGFMAPALEVSGLTQPGFIHDISFTLRQGEILGLAGLMGAGRSELARILFGLDPCERGEIRVAGQPVTGTGARGRIRAGMAFLTEDRRTEGLCLEASIADNLALVAAPRYAPPPARLLDTARLRSAIASIRQAVRLTPSARDDAPVRTLSGGNQQKVVLARWLLTQPRVLLLDEPTRGIDVGAKFEIYQLIQELADAGAGVLVISSELEELIGLCDRILVMRRGELVDELDRAAFDRERLLRGALGS
jgi:ribose transport system ATP-binding protein